MIHRSMFLLTIAGILIFLFCPVLSAKIPCLINYQGKLNTTSGGCVNDTVQMIFSIYPDTLGSPPVWTETHAQVIVKEGVFSVLLGEVDSLSPSMFDGNAEYLGIKVGTDPEMRPMKQIVSVGYAFHAAFADTVLNSGVIGLSGIDSVFNPGGNVDLIPDNSIAVIPSDSANFITIGETHSGRRDNPHNVTASQTGSLVSVKGVSNPGGDVDFVAGNNITITSDISNKTVTFSASSGGGWKDDGTVVRLETSTDSVGVGTNHPEAMLHIKSTTGTGSLKVESNTGVKGGLNCYDAYLRMGTETNHDLLLGSNNIDRIWVKSDGKVGIGTANPAQVLDVAGTVQTVGFKMPTGASSGKVLTSDTSGVGTWQIPPGGLDGSGTASYIPKFTATSTLGNSVIYQYGNLIGIGITNPTSKLTVAGSILASTVKPGGEIMSSMP